MNEKYYNSLTSLPQRETLQDSAAIAKLVETIRYLVKNQSYVNKNPYPLKTSAGVINIRCEIKTTSAPWINLEHVAYDRMEKGSSISSLYQRPDGTWYALEKDLFRHDNVAAGTTWDRLSSLIPSIVAAANNWEDCI